jgi:hypothetical protein
MRAGEVDDLGQRSVRILSAPEAQEWFALCQLEPETCRARMASSLAGLTPEEACYGTDNGCRKASDCTVCRWLCRDSH